MGLREPLRGLQRAPLEAEENAAGTWPAPRSRERGEAGVLLAFPSRVLCGPHLRSDGHSPPGASCLLKVSS